jgi:hypothetical protein
MRRHSGIPAFLNAPAKRAKSAGFRVGLYRLSFDSCIAGSSCRWCAIAARDQMQDQFCPACSAKSALQAPRASRGSAASSAAMVDRDNLLSLAKGALGLHGWGIGLGT